MDVHEYDLLLENATFKEPYEELEGALEIWRDRFLLPAVEGYGGAGHSLIPCSIVAGSDAHMDFNFALRPNPLYVYLSFNDNAFGKVRTLAHMPGFRNVKTYGEGKDLLLQALRQGCCVITDGPVVIPAMQITHKDGSGVSLMCGAHYCLQQGDSLSLQYEVKCPEESLGVRTELRLYYPRNMGNTVVEGKTVTSIALTGSGPTVGSLALDNILQDMQQSVKAGYFRLECNTIDEGGVKRGYCCTNPLWITW